MNNMSSIDPPKRKNMILCIIDEVERDHQCALWASETLDSYTPQFAPQVPYVLAQRRISEANRKPGQFVKEDDAFWLRDDVRTFLDEKWRVNLKNRVDFEHLLWIKDNLSSNDKEELVKVHNAIYNYNQFFSEESKRGEKPFVTISSGYKKVEATETQREMPL